MQWHCANKTAHGLIARRISKDSDELVTAQCLELLMSLKLSQQNPN